mmetsp:Transcript_124432/g.194946  ORF Transcript_124432/g.194946 Transcript_124432/m.194946 type:complete len:318 (-) Transcript_124432:37-990(-)
MCKKFGASPLALASLEYSSDNRRRSSWDFSFFKKAAAVGALTVGGGMQAASGPAKCESSASPVEAVKPTLLQKCMAEALGIGIIVHGGCGCICAKMYAGSGLGTFQIASVWAISVALAIFATREISGAHLNPAVSIALAAHKDFDKAELGPYLAAQMVGATAAGALNYALTAKGISAFELAEKVPRGTSASTFAGAFGMVPNSAVLGTAGALLAEVSATALFVFLIFAVTDPKGSVPPDAAPVLIGVAVAALISIFGPLTGCGMNPARDLGPRLVTLAAGWGSVALSSWWIYTVGPIIGAVLGGAVYEAFFKDLRSK